MRALVTGATGLIGASLTDLLLKAGHEVLAVSRKTTGARSAQLTEISADLLTENLPKRALRADTLFHLAWETTPGRYWDSADNQRWLQSSIRLAQRFLEAGGSRIVVAGTCAEYCWDSGVCIEGATPIAPQSAYSTAKVRLHQKLDKLVLEHPGASIAWARIFFPYGPGEAESRLVPTVLTPMLHGLPVRCSDGQQRRDFIHARDVARALLQLGDVGRESASIVVNVGSGEAHSVREIVELCAELTAYEHPIEFGAVPMRKNDPPVIQGDIGRLRSLGWIPEVRLKQGLLDYIERLKTSDG